MLNTRKGSARHTVPLMILGLVLLDGCTQNPPSPLEKHLLEEFAGSYSLDEPQAERTREYILVADEFEVTQPDGRRLAVWSYNGEVPAPTLRLKLGERLRVVFTNNLPQRTTIHWHGIRVPNAMDGVPGVTQPPIEPGDTFIYEFVPKDAGTFWFHPHHRSSEQVERGLFGAVIVEDPEPLPYSQDVLWILDDWLLDSKGAIDERFVTRRDLAHDGRWGNLITVNGTTNTTLNAKVGERIRLRLLNSANGRIFRPDLQNLDATIIAVDGMYAGRPLPYQGFELAPGNRVDLDITIRKKDAGKTIQIKDGYTRRPYPLATIIISPEVVATPSFQSPARAKMPDWSSAKSAPVHLHFELDSRRGGPHGIEWTLNNLVYDDKHKDALILGRWNQMRFTNHSYRLHPMHIHGMFFKVLARNGKPVNEPYWRDTVLLKRKESVDIGLVPLDEGEWLLHCHILEHAAAGMRTRVTVREPRGWFW